MLKDDTHAPATMLRREAFEWRMLHYIVVQAGTLHG